jgi:Flp pilus assembly protein TadD
MAYCQSQLYVEYLQEKHGPEAVGAMLQASAVGLDTAAALRKVCKVEKSEFEKGYREYLNGVVQALGGKPAEKAKTFNQLRDAHEKDPGNLDIAAKLAEQFRLRRRGVEARKLAEQVLAKDKGHSLALFVKAKLLLAAGDEEEARKLLEAAAEAKEPEPKVLHELGKLYFEARQFDKAAEMFELARKAEPYDSKWLTELAKDYGQTGDKDRQIAVLKELAPTDPDDLEVRKKLAELLLDAGRHAEAEPVARQMLEIDVRDESGREMLLTALRAQKKKEAADRLEKLLGG